jgi:hypothetical protein
MNEEIKEKFLNLACQLSPENLTCDGELSRSQVKERYKSIMVEWHKLEDELGREVTEDELYGY